MSRHGILKQAGPLMLGRGGATILGFALPLILTRLLPQAEFGTYKQVWLIVTTGYYMLQFGLAQSLYYFIPRKDGRERAWLTQASASLLLLGGVCAAVLYGARFLIARQFANPELAEFGLAMALITWLMIGAAPLEISLTAEGRVRAAAWTILLLDAVRVAASVVPLLLGMGLRGFFWAYVLHGAVRFSLQCWFFFRRGRPQLDWKLWREQLAYALPFGAAVLVDIPQRTFHQWAVGWSVDAAAFAIYAQGCFQVPIINLLYAPITDVLQVRLAQPGAHDHRAHLFHDANLRLAAVFFPFTAGMMAAASLFIPALFTHTYDPSIPIFQVAILLIPLAALPLDGVLRATGPDPLPVPDLHLPAAGHDSRGADRDQAVRDDRIDRRIHCCRVRDARGDAGPRAAGAGGDLARGAALAAAGGHRGGVAGGVHSGAGHLPGGRERPAAVPGPLRGGSDVPRGVSRGDRNDTRGGIAGRAGATGAARERVSSSVGSSWDQGSRLSVPGEERRRGPEQVAPCSIGTERGRRLVLGAALH
jgi:O-antigen/teichoic acid export membrane protein